MPQGSAWRCATTVRSARRDTRALANAVPAAQCLPDRSDADARLRPHRSAADQPDHDAHQPASRQLPLLQQAGDGEAAGRHAARLAVRAGHRVGSDLSARLPDGQLQSPDRNARRNVQPETLRGRDRQHAGACANAVRRARRRIAETVRNSPVIASDETSARVNGKTHWQWTFIAPTAVFHTIAGTRGRVVPTEFLGGARPKVWLSDRLPAQCRHADAHQYCLAHLIRDAQFAIDAGDTIFAPAFKRFLQKACVIGRRRPDLADATIKSYARDLGRQLIGCSTSSRRRRTAAIRASMQVDGHDKLLVFMTRRDVEPTDDRTTGIAALGDLPQSDERLPLAMGRQGLRRHPLHCRHWPHQRPERTHRNPRSSGAAPDSAPA